MNKIRQSTVFLFFFAQLNLCAQSIHISGVIINKETRHAIPAVSIYTKDKKTGTISTATGKFSLEIQESKTNDYLFFSSIDYEIDSIPIASIHSTLSVYLTPIIYSLKEIYIMPDSTLLTLLRKAYNKIPDNYPEKETRYEGFFQNSVTNGKDSLVEFIEAKLAVYKESYQRKREMPGQIEIIKSRMKQLQQREVFFVGGAFVPIDNDYVLQRAKFIQPQKFKSYCYELAGINTIQGIDCYEIRFHPLNKDSDYVEGRIFIETNNLAYVSFDIDEKHPENAKKIVGLINPVKTKSQVRYEKQAGKWYLKQVSEKEKYEHNWRLKEPLYARVDFITTHIQTDSIVPIPVANRLEYMDPIETKVEEYCPNGWTDIDVIINKDSTQIGFQFSTDEALAIFNQKLSKKKSFQEYLLNVFPRIIKGYGISYDPDLRITMYQMILGYHLTKKWNFRWQISTDLFVKNVKYVDNSLNIGFRQNLNNAGYPLFLETSLGIADKKYFGSYQIREQTIVPSISLSKRINKYITLELFTNYDFPIHSDNDMNINYYPKIGINFYIF
jgi:hypothetical protein